MTAVYVAAQHCLRRHDQDRSVTAGANLSPCWLKHAAFAQGLPGGSEAAKAVVHEYSSPRLGTARGEPTFVGCTC